jgi:mono/diheme cytochrome c family protein
MLRHRAAGLLISACAFGTWMIVSDALGQARDTRRSAASRAQGLAVWEQVYAVLTHPRCLNCHTATAYPQQGDDRQRHFANVVRGPEGQGVPGLHGTRIRLVRS